MKKDRICPRCKSNKGGFDTPVDNNNLLICGNCGFVFESKDSELK